MGFVSFIDEAEHHQCAAAVPRPGNVTAAVGTTGILRRLLTMVRCGLLGAHPRSPKKRPPHVLSKSDILCATDHACLFA